MYSSITRCIEVYHTIISELAKCLFTCGNNMEVCLSWPSFASWDVDMEARSGHYDPYIGMIKNHLDINNNYGIFATETLHV